jgi:hypothetical protein
MASRLAQPDNPSVRNVNKCTSEGLCECLTVLYHAVLCCAVLCCAVLCCAVLCCAVLPCPPTEHLEMIESQALEMMKHNERLEKRMAALEQHTQVGCC